jgi:hypothetical protein
MKANHFLSLAVTFVTFTCSAQLFKIGVKAGPNFSNIESTLNTQTKIGYHLGAVVEIKISPKFSIQPEAIYSSQGAVIKNAKDFDLNYVSVPVIVKYYLFKDTFSLEGGPQFSFLTEKNIATTFKSNAFDFGACGGLGLNITKQLFVQARYVVGLTEVSADAEIKNKLLQMTVGYYF